MEKLAELKGVSRHYYLGNDRVKALDNVNLIINKGEYTAVVGTSGSGKSTLMNIMGCLDVPNEGEYLVMGQNTAEMNDKELSFFRGRQIGFIFQGFNLIPSLTAKENVELPLIYRGFSKQQRDYVSRQALERVGLGHRMHHRPQQLSGGQQQRTAIARAIAARPPIILADEPTGNLDSSSGGEITKLLEQLNAEGHTVILITHDNALAAKADRLIKIKDGKIQHDSSNTF
ncbi:MAG: ABC transporter ATP-binding protein [Oscillospiraceae bacterium]|nr:ABC transporter ATP-binding protein [Oscillospiraceae bacterium]